MSPPTVPGYLHRVSIPTPFPVGPVNVYLVQGERLTLVDTGPRYDPARHALRAALRDRGRDAADLGAILLTHAHADHCGLAAEMARISGADVWTHAANVSSLTEERGGLGALYRDLRRAVAYARTMRWSGVSLPLMTKLARMRRGLERYVEPVIVDRTLADGDVIRLGYDEWQVLHTPGHAGGLICLYQPERRLLLSSDHLLRDISSNPIFGPPEPGETKRPRRLVQYLEQLRRVAALEVDLALPGHGLPITDHRSLIQQRLAFHEERACRILEALNDTPLSARQIAGLLFVDLDPVNVFLAISEVVGHLQWLQDRGLVVEDRRLGVAHWRTAP